MSRPFWNEIRVGETADLGSHLFTAEDIKRFAARYDPQAFHLDEDAARRSLLGGLCASGWHTAGIYMRLNVEHGYARVAAHVAAGNPAPLIGPSPGIRNLRWPRPVFAGETIRYTQTVGTKRPVASRPGWGLITFDAAGLNEADETVLSLEGAVFYGME